MTIKFEPTGPRVVLRPNLPKKQGLIELVYDERRVSADSDTGDVLAIGPLAFKDWGGKEVAPWYKVGDKVYYSKYGAKVLRDGKDFYIILNYEDVLAIIQEGQAEDVNQVLEDEGATS